MRAGQGQLKIVDKYKFDEMAMTRSIGKGQLIQETDCMHTESKRMYTLKRINLTNSQFSTQYERILHELSMMKKLKHSAIIHCHKILKTQTHLYLIYDQIKGNRLPQLKNTLTQRLALKIIAQLIDCVKFLISNGMCHTQLSPSRIIVQNNQQIIITELTRACEIGTTGHGNADLDGNFSATEVLEERPTNASTDIYSLGMLIRFIVEDLIKSSQSILSSIDRKAQQQQIEQIIAFSRSMSEVDASKRPNIATVESYFSDKKYQKKEEDSPLTQIDHLNVQAPPRPRRKSTPYGGNSHQEPAVIQLGRSNSKTQSPMSCRSENDIISKTDNIDFNSVDKQTIHRRNLAVLLAELARVTGRLPFTGARSSLRAEFVLLKKSAIVVSHLMKFLDKGRSQDMLIDAKIHKALLHYAPFTRLQKKLRYEMLLTQEKLSAVRKLLSGQQIIQNDKMLKYELSRENIDRVFEKNALADWRNQITSWLQGGPSSKLDTPGALLKDLSSKQLCLVFLLGMLAEFETIELIYFQFFEECSCPLWEHPFFKSLLELDRETLTRLIVSQPQIANGSKDEEIRVSSQRSLNRL